MKSSQDFQIKHIFVDTVIVILHLNWIKYVCIKSKLIVCICFILYQIHAIQLPCNQTCCLFLIYAHAANIATNVNNSVIYGVICIKRLYLSWLVSGLQRLHFKPSWRFSIFRQNPTSNTLSWYDISLFTWLDLSMVTKFFNRQCFSNLRYSISFSVFLFSKILSWGFQKRSLLVWFSFLGRAGVN